MYNPWIKTPMGLALSLSLVCPVRAQTTTNRKWESGTWQAVGGVPPNDAVLLNPYLMDVAGDTVVVADGGDMTIKAFRKDGTMLWKAGRSIRRVPASVTTARRCWGVTTLFPRRPSGPGYSAPDRRPRV